MTEKIKISPSQLKTKKRCFRKWGFQKIDGIDDPPGLGAILGTASHALAAEYYSGRPFAHMGDEELVEIHSEAPKARRLANALIAYYGDVPDPLVEVHVVIERAEYTLHGYADLIFRDQRVVVNDHKTSKNPERYAMAHPVLQERTPQNMREEILRDDEQAIVYGGWAMDHFDVDEVDLQWVYVATQGRARVLPVRATLTREHVQARLDSEIHVHAMDIVHARRTVKSAVDLPYNPEACADFGGCPFAELCPRSLEDKLAGIFQDDEKKESNDMGQSLRDRVRARRRNAPPAGEHGATNKPDETPANDAASPAVNSPESPSDPDTQRAMSQAGGNRTVATTVAEGGTPEEGAAASERDAAARNSPKKAELLGMLADGQEIFSSRQDKSDRNRPFAHGRTLNSLRKDGLLDYEEVDNKTRRVWLTPLGAEKMGVEIQDDMQDATPEEELDRQEQEHQSEEAEVAADAVMDAEDRATEWEDASENGRDAGVADAIAILLRTSNRGLAGVLAVALAERIGEA